MALHDNRRRPPSHGRHGSRRVDDSLIGSHVPRNAPARSRRPSEYDPMGTNRVEFSNARRAQRATRGYVDQVDPNVQSGESDADYARRVSRRGYVEAIQARTRKRRIATGAIVAVVVVAIALVAGIGAFFVFSDSRLSLEGSNAQEALVAPQEGEPYYALCTAQLGSVARVDDPAGQAFLVVRIDEANRILTFLSVPPQIRVEMSDGQTHPLAEAESVGGEAEMVRQVSQLLGIDIAHFARTDAEGLAALVDLVGGVPVTLEEEVDDPAAGAQVLLAGDQVLDGPAAIELLRASNYRDGLGAQAKMRALFTVNLAARASSGEGLSFASVVSDGASAVDTDWSSSQLIALGDTLRPLADATVYAAVVPGRLVEADDGSLVYHVEADELKVVMEEVARGEAPEGSAASIANVDRASITVDIRNGANVTGAAARMGELLESDGYQVKAIGNTNDNTLYPETMVIYKNADFELAAKAIVSDLAAGRVVNGGDFYDFDTNVLVIIGQDWVSAS